MARSSSVGLFVALAGVGAVAYLYLKDRKPTPAFSAPTVTGATLNPKPAQTDPARQPQSGDSGNVVIPISFGGPTVPLVIPADLAPILFPGGS